MADDTLYTLADIKDYFRGCRDNATGTARKRFEKYIGAVESAMKRYDSIRYVPVTRCYECQHSGILEKQVDEMDGGTRC